MPERGEESRGVERRGNGERRGDSESSPLVESERGWLIFTLDPSHVHSSRLVVNRCSTSRRGYEWERRRTGGGG